MKIKYMLIIALIIVLTGCKSIYKLEIKDGVFKENIFINTAGDDNNNIKYFSDNKFYAIMDGASNFIEYKKKIKNDEVKFSYVYKNEDEYRESTILKTCFKAYSVIDQGKYYILSTSNGIKCATEEDAVLLDDLDVVIKSNHKLKETNADIIDDYKYTWHFNKDNYKDGNVYIKLYKNKYVFNYENEFTIQVIIIAVFVLTILISTFIIIRRVKKAEKV